MTSRRPFVAAPVATAVAAGLLVALAGCGPKPVESFGPAPSTSGDPAYWVEGYTRPGELTREYGEGYAESFARQVCQGAFVVDRVDIRRARNAFDEFLYWQALVTCRDTALEPAPERPPQALPQDMPTAAPTLADPLPLTPAN